MGCTVDICSYKIKGELNFANHIVIPSTKGSLLRKFFLKVGLIFFRFCQPAFIVNQFVIIWYRLGILKKHLTEEQYDLIIVEDLFFLPLVIAHKKKAKILFDAREYYPRQKEHSLAFNIFEKPLRTHICMRYLRLCDKVITVSKGLHDEYKREFYLDSEIIRSTPRFFPTIFPLSPRAQTLKIVHHGAAKENRQIENMIELFSHLDKRFTLDLYLIGNPQYVLFLKRYAEKYPNVTFPNPVEYDQIIPMLQNYDIGLFFYQPTSFNLKHCLPNKLFECIQARLMIAIGPSPDMADIVRDFNCGIISKNFEIAELSRELNSLSIPQVMQYKRNSNAAAKALNWEQEGEKLRNIITNLC